jgi:hypothetical protein
MADDPFARIAPAVENMDRIRREREVSSRIRAVAAAVRKAGRECREVAERLRKSKPHLHPALATNPTVRGYFPDPVSLSCFAVLLLDGLFAASGLTRKPEQT